MRKAVCSQLSRKRYTYTSFIAQLIKFEKAEMERVKKGSQAAAVDVKAKDLRYVPSKVDYAPQIPFLRHQGAYACGMNAAAACWDIMNELLSPYSPNLSVNRMIWNWARELRRDQVLKFLGLIGQQPHAIAKNHWQDAFGVDYQGFVDCVPGLTKSYASSAECFADFGCPTEGTELTDSDAVIWPMSEGNDEAPHYRCKLASATKRSDRTCWVPVRTSITSLKYHLSTKPLRALVFNGAHFVVLIGYDDATQRAKFVNSWGDQWSDAQYYAHDGYGYFEYSKIKQNVQGAEYLLIEPPTPVPSVRVGFKHTRRQDVSLFLYGNKPGGGQAFKQIWPSGQRQDNSRNLTLTVTLPKGFVWPPSASNILNLQVYDSGGHSSSGGDLVEFSAASSGSCSLACKKLTSGPVHFSPNTLAAFSLP